MTELIRAHLSTLTEEVPGPGGRVIERPSAGDFITFFVIPAGLGAGLWLFGVKAPGADPLLAAIAVLTGLLFALLVLMFERVVHERAIEEPAAGNDPVVDAWQLLANVSWAILVAIIQLGFLFGSTLFISGALPPWLTGVVAGLFLHLGLTLLMILKRVFFMAMRIAGYRRLTDVQR